MGKTDVDIKAIVNAVQKKFGKGSVFTNDGDSLQAIPSISTGSYSIDKAIGVGGYPKGRIIEIYGQESSGKTTLATIAAANTQKVGGKVAYIDAEHALDIQHVKDLGVDVDSLLLSQPESAEEALQLVQFYIDNDFVDLIVVDSVAALVPESELSDDAGAQGQIGHQARIMSTFLRRIKGTALTTQTTVIFINQIRQKIGVIYGSKETTPGGNALKFYASLRIRVSRGKALKDKEDIIGTELNVKIEKNKVAPPFKKAVAYLFFASGFDVVMEGLSHWVNAGIVEKNGSWYSYKDERIGQGSKQVSEFFIANPILLDEVRNVFDSMHINGDSVHEEDIEFDAE